MLFLVLAFSVADAAPAAVPADASAEAFLAFYDYPGPPPTFSVRLVETREHYLVYRVTWQSRVRTHHPSNNEVPAFYFQPRRSGKMPAVVMLHTYGTRRAKREQRLCGHLAARGIACFLPFLPYHWVRTPPGHESGRLMISGDVDRTLEAVRQAMVDVRCSVDWLEDRPEVDAGRIGVVGISLGGIILHLAMGVEPRFSVGVSILGGGGVADLMWRSPIIGHVRGELEARGIGFQELRERMRVAEPLTFAALNRPRHVLMIQGRYDVIVPPRAAKAAWSALGEPLLIWLNTGHYGPALVTSQLFEVVSAYLLNQFGERRGALPPIYDYTIKVGLFMDERSGLAATVNLTLIHLGPESFLDLALTTDGPLIGLSHMLEQGAELGVGVRLGKGHGEVRPYLAFVVVL